MTRSSSAEAVDSSSSSDIGDDDDEVLPSATSSSSSHPTTPLSRGSSSTVGTPVVGEESGTAGVGGVAQAMGDVDNDDQGDGNSQPTTMGGAAQAMGNGRELLAAVEPVGDGETEEEMSAVAEYPDFYHNNTSSSASTGESDI